MAEWYGLRLSGDDVSRFILKVEYAFSLEDCAVMLAYNESGQDWTNVDVNQWATAKWQSRQDVVAAVKDGLEKRSLQSAYYYVGDNDLTWLKESFLERITKLW